MKETDFVAEHLREHQMPRLPKGHHPVGDVHLRHRKLPEGFKRYKRGSGTPCEGDAFVELMIRTAQGFGGSGIRRAVYVDWDQGEKDGHGEVVGFRLVNPPGAA